MSGGEYKVVVVQTLGCEVIQADWVVIWSATVLNLYEDFFLRVGSIVFCVHTLLIGFSNCGLKFIVVRVVNDSYHVWELAVYKLEKTFKSDKLEDEFLLVYALSAFCMVFLHGNSFIHSSNSIGLDPAKAVAKEFIRLIPGILVIVLFLLNHMLR